MRFTHGDIVVEVLPWIMHGLDLGKDTVKVSRDNICIHSVALDRTELDMFLNRIRKNEIDDIIMEVHSSLLHPIGV